MVTEEEIESISKLMRIKIMDHREHVKKVHDMISFFEMLDSADVDDESPQMHSIQISCLREDRHAAFDTRLIDKLKQYRDGYIRAPKMN